MAYAKVANGLSLFKKKPRFRDRTKTRLTRTFILPTLFGLTFAIMAFILLLMAIGYANNLVYFFVFFLISVAMTGMLLTNQNVDRVLIEKIVAENIYAGEEAKISVFLRNRKNTDSFQLSLELLKNQLSVLAELRAGDSATLGVHWKPPRRGYVVLPRLRLHSPFPFGLLRAWKYFYESKEVLVFPERKGSSVLPTTAADQAHKETAGLFRDHRPYHSTDSPRRIDWRASTRHQNLLIKNYESAEQSALRFSWDQTAHLENFEDRISQLTLWVDLAEKSGTIYSLEVARLKTELSQGFAHWKSCLEYLAQLTPEAFA